MKLNLTNFPKFKFKFKFWKYKFEGNSFFKFLKIANNTILMHVPKWLFVFQFKNKKRKTNFMYLYAPFVL